MAKKFVITISREFGTGGRKIAKQLSEMLGVKIYDRKILTALHSQFNLTEEEMNNIKAKKHNWWDDFSRYYQQAMAWANQQYYETFAQNITSKQLYEAEERILREVAEQESCIILGRTGFYIFKDDPKAFKIFLIGDMPLRRESVAKRLNITEGIADQLIKEVDEARENYTLTFSGKSRYDARNYDLVLNVKDLPTESIAKFIAECVEKRMNEVSNFK